MNKILVFATLCMTLFAIVGCATMPSTEKMYNASYAIGVSGGLVANMTDMDADTRNAVCDILGIVSVVIPATNETFEAAWTETAQKHTQKLIEEGKIDEKQGQLVMAAFKVAVKGLDYVFIVYPKAKAYKELVVASVDGFTSGFLAVFKPINAVSRCGCKCGDKLVIETSRTYDVGAYMYLLRSCK